MQFNNNFIAAAVLFASTVPAVSAVTFTFFSGSDCTGTIIATASGVSAGECLLTNGGLVESISYSDVPSGSQVQFFESGGAHLECTNGALLTLGSGSGCGTAPVGLNFDSVKWQEI